jgi:hypothetical protein
MVLCTPTPLPHAQALKTLGANKSAELPIKLFEVGVPEEASWHVTASWTHGRGGFPGLGLCVRLRPRLNLCVCPLPSPPPALPPTPQISDVVLLAPEREVGARNERRLVAVVCNNEAGFEVIHGLLNRLMEVLGVPLKGEAGPGGGRRGWAVLPAAAAAARGLQGCSAKHAPRPRPPPPLPPPPPPGHVPQATRQRRPPLWARTAGSPATTPLSSQAARRPCCWGTSRWAGAGPARPRPLRRLSLGRVDLGGAGSRCSSNSLAPGGPPPGVLTPAPAPRPRLPPRQVGTFGVVHPDVLAAFEVTKPVSALELNLEPFCFDQHGRSLLKRADGDAAAPRS